MMRKHISLVDRILGWAYVRPGWMPALVDVGCWVVAGVLMAAISAIGGAPGAPVLGLVLLGAIGGGVQGILGLLVGSYRHRWRISSFDEATRTAQAWLVAGLAVVIVAVSLSPRESSTPLGWYGVGISALALVLISHSRVVWRRYWERNRRPDPRLAKRTIIVGNDERADQVVRLMMHDRSSDYLPVAVLDDHYVGRKRVVHGVHVRGALADLARVAAAESASVVLAVLGDDERVDLADLARDARENGLELRVLPSTSQLVHSPTLADIRPPTVEDLLGRDPVDIDLAAISQVVMGRRILVTGAGGSIGAELSRQLDRFDPEALYLLDRDETALHGLQLSMEGKALLDNDAIVVADIRDRDRIFELVRDLHPDIIFHTAALKHLTLLERFPLEAAKTNVLGTMNLLDAAAEFGVERFVNISTDKAADPSSALGASKLIAERLTTRAARETGRSFVSVRFGNVLGSRGSVLPTFLAQIESGRPITVTDPAATRYFMTIPEAVRLVVQASAIGMPGEVMILDMGEPVNIDDLARQLIDTYAPGHPISYTGLRPGEKLHEVLIGEGESVTTREHPRVLHASGADATGWAPLTSDADMVLVEMRAMMSGGELESLATNETSDSDSSVKGMR